MTQEIDFYDLIETTTKQAVESGAVDPDFKYRFELASEIMRRSLATHEIWDQTIELINLYFSDRAVESPEIAEKYALEIMSLGAALCSLARDFTREIDMHHGAEEYPLRPPQLEDVV